MKTYHSHWTHSDASGWGAHCEPPGSALTAAISLTAEVCGQALSPAAAEMLAEDLGDFNESVIMDALVRCRRELQGRLKVADILARIADGRPDIDEAWAMIPQSEHASVVWTDEMAQAWGAVLPLLDAGDTNGARAAFREAYARAVVEARIRREPAHWTPSLGSDVADRERALLDALRKHRLSVSHVKQLLPFGMVTISTEEIIEQR